MGASQRGAGSKKGRKGRRSGSLALFRLARAIDLPIGPAIARAAGKGDKTGPVEGNRKVAAPHRSLKRPVAGRGPWGRPSAKTTPGKRGPASPRAAGGGTDLPAARDVRRNEGGLGKPRTGAASGFSEDWKGGYSSNRAPAAGTALVLPALPREEKTGEFPGFKLAGPARSAADGRSELGVEGGPEMSKKGFWGAPLYRAHLRGTNFAPRVRPGSR